MPEAAVIHCEKKSEFMMEEQLSTLAATHLLQHTLRSLCIHGNSQWVYAVFWRILPRNYPPPRWDIGEGGYDRTRGNRRNWILVWEDGFCNFAASTSSSSCELQQHRGLQPELFFKMSHEIYNYGEGLVGKLAADRSHKWIFSDPDDLDKTNYFSAWHNSSDAQHPRTWEAQFQAGIKTIALIAVGEGVVQLGAVNKVREDVSYVVSLRKKMSYIESIPGVLLPHPSSAYHDMLMPSGEYVTHLGITPSMSSLEALLSKLPSVVPPQQFPQYSASAAGDCNYDHQFQTQCSFQQAKQEVEDEEYDEHGPPYFNNRSFGNS